jgi:hypothetical protein
VLQTVEQPPLPHRHTSTVHSFFPLRPLLPLLPFLPLLHFFCIRTHTEGVQSAQQALGRSHDDTARIIPIPNTLAPGHRTTTTTVTTTTATNTRTTFGVIADGRLDFLLPGPPRVPDVDEGERGSAPCHVWERTQCLVGREAALGEDHQQVVGQAVVQVCHASCRASCRVRAVACSAPLAVSVDRPHVIGGTGAEKEHARCSVGCGGVLGTGEDGRNADHGVDQGR